MHVTFPLGGKNGGGVGERKSRERILDNIIILDQINYRIVLTRKLLIIGLLNEHSLRVRQTSFSFTVLYYIM